LTQAEVTEQPDWPPVPALVSLSEMATREALSRVAALTQTALGTVLVPGLVWMEAPAQVLEKENGLKPDLAGNDQS
jgi:hypothetical protein